MVDIEIGKKRKWVALSFAAEFYRKQQFVIQGKRGFNFSHLLVEAIWHLHTSYLPGRNNNL